MMKKLLILLLAALFLAVPALAEELGALLPSGAAIEKIDETAFRITTESGEVMLLELDEAGAPVSLVTETPANLPAAETSREAAEAAVLAEYPGARILFADKPESGGMSIAFLTENWSGTAVVHGDSIVSRSLNSGIFVDGEYLTYDGARAALLLLRPGALIDELELDEDDGLLLYEGEAYTGSSEYEFELSARTGRLLEWEAN